MASAASMEYVGPLHPSDPLIVRVEICRSHLEAFIPDLCKVSVRTAIYGAILHKPCFTSWISWYVQVVNVNLNDFGGYKLGGYVSISRKLSLDEHPDLVTSS